MPFIKFIRHFGKTSALVTIFSLGAILVFTPSEVLGGSTEKMSRSHNLDERVTEIETTQNAWLIALEEYKDITKFFLALISGLAALVGVVSMLMQGREQRFSREQLKEYRELVLTIDAKYQDFRTAINENIGNVTTLLGSLNDLLALSEQTTKISERMKTQLAEEEVNKKKTSAEINKRAMEIAKILNRQNIRHAHIQRLISGFVERYGIFLDQPEFKGNFQMDNTASSTSVFYSGALNANVYFIHAIHFGTKMLLNEALERLEIARKIASAVLADSYNTENTNELFPGLQSTDLKKWNRKLMNIISFHEATVLHSLGRYSDAQKSFVNALEYDSSDIDAIMHIPESRHFAMKAGDFDNVIKEYNTAIEQVKIESEDDKWNTKPREAALAEMEIKLGNCYFPGAAEPSFHSKANLKTAERHYRVAYNLLDGIGEQYKEKVNDTLYLATFSYAQALELKSRRKVSQREEVKEESRILFSKAFYGFSTQTGYSLDVKTQIMKNYILAICAKHAGIAGVSPMTFTQEIYPLLEQLPNLDEYRVFSPLSKNDFTKHQLKDEVIHFDKLLMA